MSAALTVTMVACQNDATGERSEPLRAEATAGNEASRVSMTEVPTGTQTYEFVGSSFPVTDATAEKKKGSNKKTVDATVTLHHLTLANGTTATALIVYDTHKGKTNNNNKLGPPEIDPECPPECGTPGKSCQYGVELVSMTWVQTDDETSAFTGAVTNKQEGNAAEYQSYFENSRVCTNGTEFFIHAEGKIIDTNGTKYAGKKGKEWTLEATTSTYMTTGTLTVEW
jgi:hypothetical protein